MLKPVPLQFLDPSIFPPSPQEDTDPDPIFNNDCNIFRQTNTAGRILGVPQMHEKDGGSTVRGIV